MTPADDIGGKFQELRAVTLERLKELATLNKTNQIIRENKSVEETLKHICMILPDGWQYPAFAGARIIFDDKISLTNFELTPWIQLQDFETIAGEKEALKFAIPRISRKRRRPFLEEERDLLLNLASMISGYIECTSGQNHNWRKNRKPNNCKGNSTNHPQPAAAAKIPQQEQFRSRYLPRPDDL
jgi:hypothetical protein